jgi:hypothetical protein
LKILANNYNGWGPIDAEAVEFYINALLDLDSKLLADAVLEHVKTSKYGPTIADLRSYVLKAEAEQKHGKFLTESEAWQEVKSAIGYYGQYDVEKAMESFKPIVKDVVKKIGFVRLCLTDYEKAEQKFKSMYKEHLLLLISDRTKVNQIESRKVE